MKKVFYNAKIIGKSGVLSQSAVAVENGKIVGFGDDACGADESVDCGGNYLFPGFVDVHVHGGGGADFMDGDVTAFQTAVQTHLHHGTTTIFPTTMSATLCELQNTFAVYREVKKQFAFADCVGGMHLEGPFLSPAMCGAQRKDLIVAPTQEHVDFLKKHCDVIARMTVAPEVDGVAQMIKQLLPCGISFSMGHTSATYEQAEQAYENGVSAVTHLYSATSGFHKVNQKVHIGVTQAAYGIRGIYAELIGDGCHVPKQLLRLVATIKGTDRVCLVTDAMRAAGTDATQSYLGAVAPENRVIIEDGVCKLPDRSFFAGSIGTMDRAVRFAVQQGGFAPHEAAQMASLTPATLMGIEAQKGSIEVGKDADFAVMDGDYQIKQVYLKGKRAV